jgi:hypothetical protein
MAMPHCMGAPTTDHHAEQAFPLHPRTQPAPVQALSLHAERQGRQTQEAETLQGVRQK